KRRLRGARRHRRGTRRRALGSRAHLRFVLPGPAAGRRPRQGLGPRPRHRARIRAGARGTDRGGRAPRREERRVVSPVAASRRRDANACGRAGVRGRPMRRRAGTIGFAIALAVAGCATPPTPIMPADVDYDPEAYVTPPSTPLIESPPVEPVEP